MIDTTSHRPVRPQLELNLNEINPFRNISPPKTMNPINFEEFKDEL